MKFLNRCNGYSSTRNNFSPAVLGTFDVYVKIAREEFEKAFKSGQLNHMNLHLGYRYEGNDYVLDRITSAATDHEFMSQPLSWCLDALRDCASADHWYTFEKDWGEP